MPRLPEEPTDEPEEEIETSEATEIETPDQNDSQIASAVPGTIRTVYGETQDSGTAELKIIRRIYNQIEAAMHGIDHQERQYDGEQSWMELKSDPTKSHDMALQLLETRVMQARMIAQKNRYTFDGIKQELEMLQRMMRES